MGEPLKLGAEPALGKHPWYPPPDVAMPVCAHSACICIYVWVVRILQHPFAGLWWGGGGEEYRHCPKGQRNQGHTKGNQVACIRTCLKFGLRFRRSLWFPSVYRASKPTTIGVRIVDAKFEARLGKENPQPTTAEQS